MSSTFNEIFLPSTLVNEATNLLQKWFPTYLRGMETRLGLRADSLTTPQNYTTRNNFTSIPGEELPKCVVLAPGLVGPPQKTSTRNYRGTWRLGVGIAIASKTEEDAIFLADLYGACIRAMFVKNPSINGVASNTVYVDESYDDLPVSDEIQKFRAASIWFAVDIDNVVNSNNRPPEPGTVYVPHTADKVLIEIDRA